MKKRKVLLLGALCAALSTVQTKCAAEADPAALMAPGAQAVEIVQAVEISPEVEAFDVDEFVGKVERGELTDAEILLNLETQNPPQDDMQENSYQSADPNTDRPLMRAIGLKQRAALATFIRLGANLETPDRMGFTPLILAAQESLKAMNMLIEAKADVNAKGREGWTALTRAAEMKHEQQVKALIAAKAGLDIQDDRGQTALHSGIRPYNGPPSPQIVKSLLKTNANPTIVDKCGETASVYAQKDRRLYPKEMDAITNLLVAAGAQPEQELAPVQKQNNTDTYRYSQFAAVFPLARQNYGLGFAGGSGAMAPDWQAHAPAAVQAKEDKEGTKPKYDNGVAHNARAGVEKESNCAFM